MVPSTWKVCPTVDCNPAPLQRSAWLHGASAARPGFDRPSATPCPLGYSYCTLVLPMSSWGLVYESGNSVPASFVGRGECFVHRGHLIYIFSNRPPAELHEGPRTEKEKSRRNRGGDNRISNPAFKRD